MASNFIDCELGRRMEINVAKMQKDIEYIKIEQKETKDSIKQLDDKFDKFIDAVDKKYAEKNSLEELKRKINWATTTAFSALISILAFLINYVFF
ncbi:MAG: hypothetical protein EOM21_21610 [Gammaproteobacteria bacterium]|nr:hypothetical protein [Gammaproteobacteria bacterium]